MNKKTNNPSWCCDRVEELIQQYKHKIYALDQYELDLSARIAVRNELEKIICDLEHILYD